MKNHLFIDACFGRPVDRAPVWMMRQAGRYLPEYRAIRKKHSFIEMYKSPELATEVTLQPIDIVGADAAILFSDILVIPEAMGMALEFHEGRGPVLPQPLRDEKAIDGLETSDVAGNLTFVYDAIKMLRRELNERVPLIGFSGAPWTLATYMVEGGGSKNYKNVKGMRFARPDLLEKLLDKLGDAVVAYCKAQIEAGAQAIQLFDSWAGNLDAEGYLTYILPRIKKTIAGIKTDNVPVIYFARGAMHLLDEVSQCGADVVGIDWSITSSAAKEAVAGRCAVQGNLDPTALYAGPDVIRKNVRTMIEGFKGSKGYVANLGHGILPDIPVEHAKAFIASVKEESAKIYKNV